MDGDLHLSLTDHLAELRGRLIRVALAVLALGAVSLVFARDLFELLMRPVLAALPEGARSLVYTSGIEELNVLLKVGLYAGLFLATPVALFQLWRFVAPGLLKGERRLLGPFVTLGTLFFLLGSAFCYLAVLPTMFAFLLSPNEDAAVLSARVERAEALAADAGRLWILGEVSRAGDFARRADEALGAETMAASGREARGEIAGRLARFGWLLDLAVGRVERAESLRPVVERHARAQESFARGEHVEAAQQLDEAMALLSQSVGAQLAGEQAAVGQAAGESLWRVQKRIARDRDRLNEASWTRPMLSMREQLSLVLVLELAFGLIFELPLLMAALALLGLLRFAWIQKAQRYAVVGCVVVAALITPTGDVINLALMAVPMLVCFEVGALLVFVFERRRRRGEALDGALDDAPDEG